MPTQKQYGYVPNSTKVDRGYLSPKAFTNTLRKGTLLYHTNDECLNWDPVVASPTIVWHHPYVGTYVLDLKTTWLRNAKKCQRCEWFDSGRTKAPRNREREAQQKRERRAAKAAAEGRTVREYRRVPQSVSDPVL